MCTPMVALGSAPDGVRWRPEGIPPSHDHLLPLLIMNQVPITLATVALSLTPFHRNASTLLYFIPTWYFSC
jgi:hypothetical protein